MRIVIICPFPAERAALEELLRGEGHDVVAFAGTPDGIDAARTANPEVVIADCQAIGLDCRDFLRRLAQVCSPRVILLGARAGRSEQAHGAAYLTKPIALGDLYRLVAPQGAAAPRVA